MTSLARRLRDGGQSLWLDSFHRVMLRSGALARYVAELEATGLTSNPTILGHAMAASQNYDDSLRSRFAQGTTDPQDLVYAGTIDTIPEVTLLPRAEDRAFVSPLPDDPQRLSRPSPR